MNDVKRKMLEGILIRDSCPEAEFDSWLESQAMIPQQISEYLHECKTDEERREYLSTLLRMEPSAYDVVKSCMDDMLPSVSEEFRRGAAQGLLDRLKRLGFQVIAPEQTQFDLATNRVLTENAELMNRLAGGGK